MAARPASNAADAESPAGKGKERGKGRGKGSKGKARSPSQGKWMHPDGLLLQDLEVGSIHRGVVTNICPSGIFVDVGAVKDGLLRKSVGGLRIGDHLDEVLVRSVDVKNERILLALHDEGQEQGPDRRSQSLSEQRGARQRSLSQKNSGRTPLHKVEKGSFVTGSVKNVNIYGVFFDIGAACDARLKMPSRQGMNIYSKGDVVRNLHIDWVDMQGKIQVSLPGSHDDTIADHQARPSKPDMPRRRGERKPLESFRVGSVVDGIVTQTGKAVFVDIGCVERARLEVPPNLVQEMRQGDEIVGMHVDLVDVERRSIVVSIDDPELAPSEEEEEVSPPPSSSARRWPGRPQEPPVERRHEAPPPAARRSAPPEQPMSSRPSRKANMLSVGDFLNGVVTRCSPYGVFVDAGRGTDARLVVAPSLISQFRKGDQVYGMRVERIGPRPNELLLAIEEPRLDTGGLMPSRPLRPPVEERQPRRQQPRAAPAAARPPTASKRKSLESLTLGAKVSGVITSKSSAGVFLDFGAACEGRLLISLEEARKLRVGDMVQDVEIDSVSLSREEVVLALTYELEEVTAC